MSPQEAVVIEASPPAYEGYGTIREIHVVRVRSSRGASRAFLVTTLLLLITLAFSAICFVAWNFYNLSECEKNRLPWEKPCKDWLGKDSFFWGAHRRH